MYCPVCNAEYRAGSTECANCQVALVERLPEEGAPEFFRVVWEGENVAFATRLVEELGNAGIEGAEVPLDVLERNRRDFFDVAEKPLFGSAVSVRSRDYDRALRMKELLLEQDPGEDEAGLADAGGRTEQRTGFPDLPLEWDSGAATIELWHGTEPDACRFLLDALHNVGIPTREEAQGNNQLVVFVRPEDAERGGEIMREVIEARPPE